MIFIFNFLYKCTNSVRAEQGAEERILNKSVREIEKKRSGPWDRSGHRNDR